MGLVTTFSEAVGRAAMHGVRMEFVRAQAAARLPLREVQFPWPCSNEAYEYRMPEAFEWARLEIAFEDLHLEDIRAYRERQLASTEIWVVFNAGPRQLNSTSPLTYYRNRNSRNCSAYLAVRKFTS